MRAQDQRAPQRERRLRVQVRLCARREGSVSRPCRAARHRTARHRTQALSRRQAGAEERALPSTTPQCEPGPNEERNRQGKCVCLKGFERDQTVASASNRKPLSKKRRTPRTNATTRARSGATRPRAACRPRSRRRLRARQERGAQQARSVRVQGGLRPRQERTLCRADAPVHARPERGAQQARAMRVQGGYDHNNGRCVAPAPQCTPGPNEERNTQGQCVCKKGYDRDKNGRCVAPINPERECKEKGGLWDDKPSAA